VFHEFPLGNLLTTHGESYPARKHVVTEDLQSSQDDAGTTERLQEAHLENKQLFPSKPSREAKEIQPLRHLLSNFSTCRWLNGKCKPCPGSLGLQAPGGRHGQQSYRAETLAPAHLQPGEGVSRALQSLAPEGNPHRAVTFPGESPLFW